MWQELQEVDQMWQELQEVDRMWQELKEVDWMWQELQVEFVARMHPESPVDLIGQPFLLDSREDC